MNDPMTKTHTMRVVTAGVGEKTIEVSAMGPVGSGASAVDVPQPEALLTVAEQDTRAKAKAKAAKSDE